MEEVSMVKVKAEYARKLVECTWHDIEQPGAYVDLETGYLYRIPTEALQLAFLHPHVTAVRPAIGVAMAAGLLFGTRVWPGVFLGTFLVRILPLGAVAPALGIA